MIVARMIGANDRVIQRRCRSAFAGNFCRDALVDFRRQARIDQNGQLRLPKHIDESRRNHFASSIDGSGASRCVEIADSHNLAVPDSNISGVPGRAGAIDDVAVGDDNVERLRCGGPERRAA